MCRWTASSSRRRARRRASKPARPPCPACSSMITSPASPLDDPYPPPQIRNIVAFVHALHPQGPLMANTTATLKLSDLAREIARYQSKLVRLRRKLDDRL